MVKLKFQDLDGFKLFFYLFMSFIFLILQEMIKTL